MPWSQAKQLRTVVETELSVDDVFDLLLFSLSDSVFKEAIKRHGKSKKIKEMAAGSQNYPFVFKEANMGTALFYRQIPLPWYVTMQCFGD